MAFKVGKLAQVFTSNHEPLGQRTAVV
jgi:hypothetical protein